MSRQRRLKRNLSRLAHLRAARTTPTPPEQERLEQEIAEQVNDYHFEERDPLEELR